VTYESRGGRASTSRTIAAILYAFITRLVNTIVGGLREVIYPRSMQAVVLIVGSVTLMFIGFHAVGGMVGPSGQVPQHHPTFSRCGRHCNHRLRFPWTPVVLWSAILELSVSGLPSTQLRCRECWAAKNIHQECPPGTIFAGYLKILPGSSSSCCPASPPLSYQNVRSGGMARLRPLKSAVYSCPPPPIGFQGLVLASHLRMLAALMSYLSSRIGIQLVRERSYWDVYRKGDRRASEARLVFWACRDHV